MLRESALALLCALPTPALAQDLTVCGYNVESGGSDPSIVGLRLSEAEGVDIWGLSEVQSENWAQIFEDAAETGENADYRHVTGTTGGADPLVILYNSDVLEEVYPFRELTDLNIGGKVRAPLYESFRIRSSGEEFLFMVNHLDRSNEDARHQQARLLNEWVTTQAYPVIAVGDYNFDWSVTNGEADHDQGYDNMIQDGRFAWVRPATIVKTQDSGYDSDRDFAFVLDFAFVSGPAQDWGGIATIVMTSGDFPDDSQTSDHRPMLVKFHLTEAGPDAPCLKAQMLARIAALEAELAELRTLIEQLGSL